MFLRRQSWLWQECAIFCSTVHYVPGKLKTCHPVVWCYVLQHLLLVRRDSKVSYEELSTRLPVVHSTLDSPDVLTFSDFVDEFFPRSISIGLNSSSYRCNMCPQIFHNTFWSISRLEDPFPTFFYILPEQLPRISLSETAVHKMDFRLSLHFTSMPCSSGKKLLFMHAWKKNWVSLYNDMLLIVVWLLLWY